MIKCITALLNLMFRAEVRSQVVSRRGPFLASELQEGEVEKKETEALHKAAGETVQAAVKAGIDRKKIQEGTCCTTVSL